jgi:hypothetical protein
MPPVTGFDSRRFQRETNTTHEGRKVVSRKNAKDNCTMRSETHLRLHFVDC